MRGKLTKLCAAASCAAIIATGFAPGAAAEEKAITFSLSDQMRVTYYWLYLPEILGYWKEEGLSVDVQSVGGSLEALQQVVAGNAQFGQMGSANVIQANAQENLPIQVLMLNGVFQWALAVPADSDIKSAADLKGKSVGVFSMSTNGNLFLKAWLADQGLDPESDVSLLPVGFGGPALQALKNGEVAGLYFWPSAFVSYEDQGMAFRYFRADEWAGYPDYAVAGMKATVDGDPALAEGFVRGMIKATVFAQANPECAVQLFWKHNPDAKPANLSDADALAQNVRMLKGQLHEAELAQTKMGGADFGAVTPAAMASLQDFLLEAGLIKAKADPANLAVGLPGFFGKVNDFDKAAIVEAAKACAA